MAHKMHYRNPRLFVNAGMRFPQCAANAELLDTDKSAWPTTSAWKFVTCHNCLRIGNGPNCPWPGKDAA